MEVLSGPLGLAETSGSTLQVQPHAPQAATANELALVGDACAR